MPFMSRNLTGTLLVLLSVGGYSFFSIFTKMATAAGVRPFDLAVWRFVLASAIFWLSFPLWRKWGGLAALTRRDVVVMLLLGVLFTASALTAFIGLATAIPASTYTLLANTAPAIVVLISLAQGERLPIWSWLAVGMAILGSTLILKDQLRVESMNDLFWPLANAVCVAVYMVAAQRTTRHIPGVTSGIFIISGACLTLLLIGLVHGIDAPRSADSWLPVLGLAFFSTVIGVAAMLAGMRYIGAPRASLISSAGPPATLILASLFLGDRLAVIQYVGGALVLASVLMVNLPAYLQKAVERGLS
jgi:drug/metabolite transporter (DMT)-like permease